MATQSREDETPDREEETSDPASSVGVRFLGWVGAACAIGVACLAIFTAAFGALPPEEHRTFAVLVASVVLVLTKYNLAAILRGRSPVPDAVLWAIDIGLLAILAVAVARFQYVYYWIIDEFYELEPIDVWIAFLGIAVLMEVTRRVWGKPLVIVTAIFLAYIFWGDLLPETFAHIHFTNEKLAESLWYDFSGVFSTIMGIVLNLVWVFVVFGCLLEATGAGESLLRIAFALTGGLRGGPAHAAIVASGLFGTMSGSTVANVVGTGTFTIPMIKKRGFTNEFAAGIEATASSGGQIVPPIMGAAAFVMADLTGTPYLMITLAALVPAALYYYNLFVSVTLESRRMGIEPIAKQDRIKLERSDIFKALMFLLPIFTVIGTLVSGMSASYAGFLATVTAVVSGLFNPDLRREPMRLVRGMIKAGRNASSVLLAIALIGIIIAAMNMTGAGLKFASFITFLGQGQLFLSLVLAMLGALLLGMGMPTLPAYLIIVLILGPAVEQMGLSTLTIHMFVFYFGVASSITPPVALAAYAAAPIAQANPLLAGVMAVRLGAAKFLVPFLFAYNPTMLLIEVFDPLDFTLVLGRTLLAFFLLASAMSGFQRVKLKGFEVILRVVAGFALLLSFPVLQAAGFAGAVVLLFVHHTRSRAMAAG